VAGVIKVVQAMRHGVLPKTLHVDRPIRHVDWSQGAVELLTEAAPWPEVDRPRRAGVSSFGISGTNAHVIVEAPPAPDAGERRGRNGSAPAAADAGGGTGGDGTGPRPVALVVSGRGEAAMRARADQVRRRLVEHPDEPPAAVAAALDAIPRLEDRAVAVGRDRDELLAALSEPATVGRSRPGKLAFAFTGQGTQRLGMGRELHAAWPAFAEAFDAVCTALDPHLARPLREVMWGDDAAALDHTAMAQPALFAVEVALATALRSLGVTPDLVLGHSVGELAAAHVAGVLSLADAARLVAARGG
jgi:acyl transferase domain-containing protein